MAIQSSWTSRIGVTFDIAYTVIGRLSYHKFAKIWFDNLAHDTTGEAYIYANETARQNGAEPVDRVGISFDVDLTSEDNPVAQAYSALKQIAGFTSAVDV